MNCTYCLDLIDLMLSDKDYNFVFHTLESMKQWIEDNDCVTPKQAEALENIYKSKEG